MRRDLNGEMEFAGVTGGGQVEWVSDCRLVAHREGWAFAREQAEAIEAHWRQRLLTHPGYFNGIVYAMAGGGGAGADGVYAASMVATDFKSFLYWKEAGYLDMGIRDAFGSAILRSREGHVLLGRQSAGNINAGQAYLPGGFIDQRDVAADGTIDIGASIARELAEETGLRAGEVETLPGFRIISIGHQVSMAREFCSALGSDELRALILSRIGADAEAELMDIVVVRSQNDLSGKNVPAYTALALEHVFKV
ncbi:MAG: NUDIX hydrolase [Hyphomicrobiaceae bacterium]